MIADCDNGGDISSNYLSDLGSSFEANEDDSIDDKDDGNYSGSGGSSDHEEVEVTCNRIFELISIPF